MSALNCNDLRLEINRKSMFSELGFTHLYLQANL